MAKCTICGKEFNNSRPQQSLVLHMEKAHGMRKQKGGGYIPISEIEQPYEGQWRMLDPNDPMESDCIDAGYVKICEVGGVPKSDWEVE